MTEGQSDLDKALIIYKESKTAFEACRKELQELQHAFNDFSKAMNIANTHLQRVLNEEKNKGNIHKTCEWYDSEKDYCTNYMMGKYTGLAFEVSRNEQCIDDMVKE